MGGMNKVLVFVFSTYVEVILKFGSKMLTLVSILHVCGGDPASLVLFAKLA